MTNIDPLVLIWILLSMIGLPYAASLLYATRKEDEFRQAIERETGIVNVPLTLYLKHAKVWAGGGVAFLLWALVVGLSVIFETPWRGDVLRYGLVILLALLTGGLMDSWRVRHKIAESEPLHPGQVWREPTEDDQ